MTTKVLNKNRFSKFQKHGIATAALSKALKPKPEIVILNVTHYPTYIEVYFLKDCFQVRAKIEIRNMENFIHNDFNVPAIPSGSDMNISIYLDENLEDVTRAYLTAGKEIMPL